MTRYWRYMDTDIDGDAKIESRRTVFGLNKIPDQYRLAFVPHNTEVLGLVDSTPAQSSNSPDIPLLRFLYRIFSSPLSTPKLSSSFNLVKGMVALLQSLYASLTLYRTNGGQVNRYGYAAPGLTVLPYAVMSTLNLMANLVAPHYPTLYLVRSEVMEEAEQRTEVPFHYVVGSVVDESDTNDVKEGWSEVAGSFKDDDELLHVSPSAEEDEKIKISDSSHQTIYVPACPKFRRTNDFQTSPLRLFIESEFPLRGLQFPDYMARREQVLIQPSLQIHPRNVGAPRPRWLNSTSHCLRRCQRLASTYLPPAFYAILMSIMPVSRSSSSELHLLNNSAPPQMLLELGLSLFIIFAELLITLAVSKFKGQQSTVAQRGWTVAWLIASIYGLFITLARRSQTSDRTSKFMICYQTLIVGAPAIGGFVVVFQMLNAYGICYKFV